jgi:hypothetical protein
VAERVLGLPLHRRTPVRPNELFAGEVPQDLGHRLEIAVAHVCDRAGPEDLADHRCIRQQRLGIRLERVQTGGDQRVHGVREEHLRPAPQLPARAFPDEEVPILEQPDELLRVERVAAGTFEDRPLQISRQHRRLQERRHQARGLLL